MMGPLPLTFWGALLDILSRVAVVIEGPDSVKCGVTAGRLR